MPAGYRFDGRVEDLLGALAVAVLGGAQAEDESQQACIDALRRLEDLRVVAAYTQAGVPADDPPLCDPAGIAAVNAMWEAVTAELGDEGWERITGDWWRR